jgi:phage gp29-like protein
MQHGQPAWNALTTQLQALVDNATSLSELQQTLTQAYGGLASDQLVKLMAAALALAELKGMDDARA